MSWFSDFFFKAPHPINLFLGFFITLIFLCAGFVVRYLFSKLRLEKSSNILALFGLVSVITLDLLGDIVFYVVYHQFLREGLWVITWHIFFFVGTTLCYLFLNRKINFPVIIRKIKND